MSFEIQFGDLFIITVPGAPPDKILMVSMPPTQPSGEPWTQETQAAWIKDNPGCACLIKGIGTEENKG